MFFPARDRRHAHLTLLLLAAWLVVGSAPPSDADVFLDANFDADADGFSYTDDPFRATSAPTYASGAQLPAGGETGGGLEVRLGNIDTSTVNGMSGGHQRSFVLPTATDNVMLTLRYQLTQASDYESDEFSQALVSLDGVLLSGNGPDYVAQVVGNGNGGSAISTGWTTFSSQLGSLAAGSYDLIVGGYNNKKTFTNEETVVLFDDVRVEGDPVAPCTVPADCDDGNACTDDTCNAGTCESTPNTAPCDDGLACTDMDVCSAGVCTGSDLCLGDSSCNATSGVCEEPAAPNLVGTLDLQNFKDHIEVLSSSNSPINGSRHWSQPGNSAALDYLETELEGYGYTVERHAYTFSSQTRENVYATKVGVTVPEEMVIVSAHMDSINFDSSGSVFAPGANDDASGTSLVLEAARVFADTTVTTDRTVRFILWNNEETGLNGSSAYVADRRSLQGVESPPGSGLYPEPNWIAVIQHDMMMWDHGLPSGPEQIPGADNDIEYQASSTFATDSLALANLVHQANIDYAPAYPSEVTNDMCCTDSVPFQNDVAAISVRENRRRAEIGNGSNPNWHRNSDVFETYSEADFALGFNALQATVGAVAELVGARSPTTCGDGTLDPEEQCDDGNLVAGDCCSPFCSIEPAGTLCRDAVGVCDLVELCDGTSDGCPADTKSSGICRPQSGACDIAEACDGVSDACPGDAVATNTFTCRPAAGVCDAAELCDGVGPACPGDAKRTDECRATAGVCDVAEQCDGIRDDCPGDTVLGDSEICRAAASPCDASESCDGASPLCPADVGLTGTPCTDEDACTTSDVCSAGVCLGGPDLDCDDANPCTADACDAFDGCSHTVIPGCQIVEVPSMSAATRGLLVALVCLLAAGSLTSLGVRRFGGRG